MENTGRTSAIALCVGTVALAAAAVEVLFRRTTGMTGARRFRMMYRLVATAVRTTFPSRCAVASVAAGLFAFAGTLVAGIAVTVLIVRAIPPEVPNPTEAYEGIGDAMLAQFWFYLGGGVSLFVACSVGVVTGSWVASRWSTRIAPHSLMAHRT